MFAFFDQLILKRTLTRSNDLRGMQPDFLQKVPISEQEQAAVDQISGILQVFLRLRSIRLLHEFLHMVSIAADITIPGIRRPDRHSEGNKTAFSRQLTRFVDRILVSLPMDQMIGGYNKNKL